MKLIFIFFITLLLHHCSSQRCIKIDYSNLQGYYKYLVVDEISKSVIDTVYSCVHRIHNNNDVDSIRSNIDLIDNVLITNEKILGVYSIAEKTNNLLPITFTYYDINKNIGDVWDLESEIGMRMRPWGFNFKILSRDSLALPIATTFSDFKIVMQKEWTDVEGYNNVRIYGYDNLSRIVYLKKYRIDKTNKISNNNECLILDSIILSDSINAIQHDDWISRNSNQTSKWFGRQYIEEDLLEVDLYKN